MCVVCGSVFALLFGVCFCCLMFWYYVWLFVVRCLMFAGWCSLFAIRCVLLFVVCCLLCGAVGGRLCDV